MDKRLEDQCINTLRFLAVDAIQKANSGHPGMPLGASAMAYVIWHDYLRFDPEAPDWMGRDRFVLSAGHASGLMYALLHCAGTGLRLEELEQFRQWGSRTPGHPEFGLTPGVETTTGPLGQGFATGVGMALAAKLLAARFGEERFNERVLGIVSDGDMMEGITNEAASLAGHWGLDNLVYFYDANDITIEGDLSLAMSENVGDRFRALGWFVQEIDGLDTAAIRGAMDAALAESARPSLVVGKTRIGYGSPKEGQSSCHGSPLGAEGVEATKKKLGWPEKSFFVPDEVRQVWKEWAGSQAEQRLAWEQSMTSWAEAAPEAAASYKTMVDRELPADLLEQLIEAVGQEKGATRALSGKALQRAAALVPGLIGGSADLAPSNKTMLADEPEMCVGDVCFEGRNIHFGIREHAMAAIANGMSLHGPWRPYIGTFLVFTDYMRPSMRLAGMMGQPIVYVMTHDSFFVGEDGPTHQPVEHLWALRVMPRVRVLRPADGVETAAAWTIALESKETPYVLALSRQGLPPLERPAGFDPRSIERGAYLLAPEKGERPELVIVATGSEVADAVEAKKLLEKDGIDARVVSMPCVELFLEGGDELRQELLPAGVPAVSIEAGVSQPWRSIVGADALVIGLDDFGASAPYTVLKEKFGFTAEQIAARIREWML